MYTSQQAADMLGISKWTFNRWVKQGGIHFSQTTPGGHRRYDYDEIMRAKRELFNEPGNLQDNEQRD